jgi:NADP-dependent 3-hydroxy acid dehydrogenase YdfG
MRNFPSAVTGKVVLITGASSGIGEATARHLALLGHKVVLGARRTDRTEAIAAEIVWDCGEALALPLDVTDLASMQGFATAAKNHFGRIDVLVNNAAVMPQFHPADDATGEWTRMIDVNLRGVLHGIAAVVPGMKAQGFGHIINVASTAHRVDPGAVVDCAGKHAVRAVSEGLRQDSRELRVTVVSPGFPQTEPDDGVCQPHRTTSAGNQCEQSSIPASTIAAAIGYAIGQPAGIDVNELVIRPVGLS